MTSEAICIAINEIEDPSALRRIDTPHDIAVTPATSVFGTNRAGRIFIVLASPSSAGLEAELVLGLIFQAKVNHSSNVMYKIVKKLPDHLDL